jgi:hypothetical protein
MPSPRQTRLALIVLVSLSAASAQAQHRHKTPPPPTPTPTPAPATLLWSSEFDTSADIAVGVGQKWVTSWPLGSGIYSAANAGEVEIYVDVQNGDRTGPNPFTLGQSMLCIAATPTAGLPAGFTYTSGCLSTYGLTSWKPPYYIETRCLAPTGKGFWPGLNLYYGDGKSIPFSWPPEIDIFQFSSRLPTQYYPAALVTGQTQNAGAFVNTPDLSQAMHTYGAYVTSNVVTFYFDGALVLTRKLATPITGPMWATLNMAVGDGGAWIGPPDGSTAKWWIDYVRVYSSKPS